MLDKLFEEEKVQVCTIHENCEDNNKENKENIEPLVVKKRQRKMTAKLEDIAEKGE